MSSQKIVTTLTLVAAIMVLAGAALIAARDVATAIVIGPAGLVLLFVAQAIRMFSAASRNEQRSAR